MHGIVKGPVESPGSKPKSDPRSSSPFKLRQSISIMRDLGMNKTEIRSYLRRFALRSQRHASDTLERLSVARWTTDA